MNENGKEDITSEQFFALSGDNEIVKRFKLILRSGETVSVPYSLLPAIILTNECELLVRAYGLLITVKGRNMKALSDYVAEEQLLWMKESPNAFDTGDAFIFISEINISGRTVSKELRKGEL